MKYSIVLFLAAFCMASPQNTSAQVYVEEFDSGFPSGWIEYTEAGFDFVSWYGGEMSMFKQSDGNEILLFGTDLKDLSMFTKWEVDMYAYNLNFTSNTKPYIEMGVMTDPNDITSFESIKVLHVTNESLTTFSVFLGAYDEMAHLALKMVGERSQITYIDNWKLYDDVFDASFPLAVDDLTMTPAPNGGLSMTVEWTNPSREADGDALTTLDAIEFYTGNTRVATYSNPIIGAMESTEILVDSSDYYSIRAVPISNGVAGYERESTTQWVGLDYPAAVQNLTLALDDDNSTLTWEPPIAGGNGGYFDGEITEYLLTRCDGKFITVPGNLNSFTESLDMMGTINYVIEARNSSDIGDAITTNNIYYVSSDYLYYDNFWVDVVQSLGEPTAMGPSQWQTESTTTLAGWSYFTSNFTNTDPGEISYLWSSQGQTDQIVRLVSPVINTVGSNNITLQLNSYLEASNSAFSFYLETSSDGDQNWTEVHEWNIDGIAINEITTKVVANSDVGSENFQFAITFKGNPAVPGFIRFDNIRVFDQPSIDIKVSEFDALATVEPGDNISFSADIENNSTTLVDCSVKCTVTERFGTQILYENELVANNMAIGETRIIDFGSWTGEEGEYIVDISIIYPGGDDNPGNDISSHELNVLRLGQRERVLMEDFTGTWCSYCPGAALGITELMNSGYQISVIGRHREDDYETADIENRMAQYSVAGFPTMMIDGVVKLTGGHQTLSVASLYIDDINKRYITKSSTQLEVIQSKLEGNTYNAVVSVNSLSKIQNPNYELRASIIESHIEDEWLGIPTVDEAQRYYSDHPLDLSDGSDMVTLSFTLDDVLNTDNTEMVVYIQDVSTNEVINATLIDINLDLTSITEIKSAPSFAITPNPTSDLVNIQINNLDNEALILEVINPVGQLIIRHEIDSEQIHELDLSECQSGVYMVRLVNKQGIATVKKCSVIR